MLSPRPVHSDVGCLNTMVALESPAEIDRPFVAIVERILNKTLELHHPEDVYVVLIDNWFDHKWLEFESSRTDNDASGWRNKLTLPRFEPSRVVSQSHYGANPSNSTLYETSESHALHILADRRFLDHFCSSGVFVWYSLVGPRADRASVMVYINSNGRGSAWYVSFTKNEDWNVNKMKGISKRELTDLMTVAT
jgi:hypothetical protein